jgi:adenylylsulfate kinase-like enzyme
MQVEVLDGELIRTHLSQGLGFSKEDRDENVRRIGFVGELLARNGVTAIAAAISPSRAVPEQVRTRILDFVEVCRECPVEEMAVRDLKGLYMQALAAAWAPEVTVSSFNETPGQSLERIRGTLGLIPS